MPGIEIKLPQVVVDLIGGPREVRVEGETLREALARLIAERPLLEVHLFEDSGALRQHVIFFHNASLIRHGEGLDAQVEDGDQLTILNSVAGG